MDIGVNLPWGTYGYDFGVAFSPGLGKVDWRTFIPSKQQELASRDIKVMRMFILAGGQQCQPQPQLPGGVIGKPSLTKAFIDDFENLLKLMKSMNMQLIPVFINYQFCWAGEQEGTVVKGGRADLLDDPLRADFLANVLKPLVDKSNEPQLSSTIYAWELINEPELCTDGTDPKGHANVRLDKMKAFIKEGCSIIHAANPSFDTTVGFQYFQTLKKPQWDVAHLGITRYQFHYYGDSDYDGTNFHKDPIPTTKRLLRDRRCFIGEIGTTPYSKWGKLGQAQDLKFKLQEVDTRKYRLVLLWSMTAHLYIDPIKGQQDLNSKWDQSVLNDIDKYRSQR